jgi:hypothetical protein
MHNFMKFVWVVLAVLLLIIILNPPDAEKPRPSLDYSKPIFTDDFAIICPIGILFDVRVDHGPDAVLDMFISPFGMQSKAEKLGCEVWRGGIRVNAVRADGVIQGNGRYLNYVRINDALFTIEADLTNDPQASKMKIPD